METIAKARIQMVIFALLAFWSLIAAVVLAIILIVKKKKRRQMKKTKIAAVVFALLVPVMSFISVNNWFTAIQTIVDPIWVPDLVGLDYDECQSAYGEYFELIVQHEEYSYEYPKGTIMQQDPVPRSMVSSLPEIRCIVSRGVRMVDVADVIGLDFEDAKVILEESTFTVGFVSEYSDDVPNGKVIATDPPAFEKAAVYSAVKVTVSGGKEPDVTDDNE
ncbi:MAG: PASTA domain-containing protein [Ruminococcus sp.]|nr:PASTA domain-containing protein [Ruminococcus sp.]